VLNGVRQGGVLNPILHLFRRSHIKITEARLLRKMLDIYDWYSNEYSIKFNANKSKCLYFPINSALIRLMVIKMPLFTVARDYIQNMNYNE
jgi:hypothetical protein